MAICIGFDEEKVHSLYPEASMVSAMKIWQLPKNKKDKLKEYCDSGDYVASLKIDGFFYMLNKTPQYTYLFSRNPGVNGFLSEKIDRVPHIKEAMKNIPADTLLVGEIYVPGKTSKAVTRIMGSLPDKAIARQEAEGYLHYYLNDIILYDGEDVRSKPFTERAEILQKVYDTYLSEYDFISVAENIETDIYETAMKYIAMGEEGMVLRKKTSLYECGLRPAWSSIKIKQVDTIDVVITGFGDPTKEYNGTELETWPYMKEIVTEESGVIGYEPVTKAYYYGWKNRIEISAYDEDGQLQPIGTISSGLTDELRQAFAETPESFLYKVIEVQCMSVDNKEKTIRHGYFKRFRDDKNPEDCLISEIFK